MRKIIESSLMSLDGVVGDPHLWGMDLFDDRTRDESLRQLQAVDAMLMGRRTYEIFVQLWSAGTNPYLDRINGMRKYVFSSTLQKADWNNSVVVRGDVVAETTKLKQQEGRDLIVYGHARLGRTLLRHGLLDELRVAIYPKVVGKGNLFFQEGEAARLDLVSATTRDHGVVTLSYRPRAA